MLNRSRGFTLIELMIVVAIIGILASLAIATFKTYSVRAQVAEGLNLASGLKAAVVNAYMNDGVAAANRAAAGIPPAASASSGAYVSSVDIIDGRIEVTFGGPKAHNEIVGMTFSLTPYLTQGNVMNWRCGSAGAPAGNLLNGGSAHTAPTVDERYLPGSCR